MGAPDPFENASEGQVNFCLAVVRERGRQDARWGGQEHDRQHSAYDWVSYIEKHAKKAVDTKPMPPAKFGYQMVRVAALAMAAYEWCAHHHAEKGPWSFLDPPEAETKEETLRKEHAADTLMREIKESGIVQMSSIGEKILRDKLASVIDARDKGAWSQIDQLLKRIDKLEVAEHQVDAIKAVLRGK
jgi:hypothetical protein